MGFKVLIIGESGVGKTQILQKFESGEFTDNYLPTIGTEFQTNFLTLLDMDVHFLEIGGTGLYEFFNVLPIIENVDLVIFVCEQFTIHTSQLLSYLKIKIQEKNLRRVSFLIVRNKIDLIPFTTEELENITQYCLIHSLTFLPISSKSEDCVHCLEWFIFQIMKNHSSNPTEAYPVLAQSYENAAF